LCDVFCEFYDTCHCLWYNEMMKYRIQNVNGDQIYFANYPNDVIVWISCISNYSS